MNSSLLFVVQLDSMHNRILQIVKGTICNFWGLFLKFERNLLCRLSENKFLSTPKKIFFFKLAKNIHFDKYLKFCKIISIFGHKPMDEFLKIDDPSL